MYCGTLYSYRMNLNRRAGGWLHIGTQRCPGRLSAHRGSRVLEDQWPCESVRGSWSLLRLPALARPRLTM